MTPISGGLHHIEIYVVDLLRTRRFWSWLLEYLGYGLHQEWPEGFSYKLAGTYIVFVQVREEYMGSNYHRCRPGLNHLAFLLPTQADVKKLRAALLARGVNLLYDDRYPYAGGEGHFAVYFEDPDRMKIEVVADE